MKDKPLVDELAEALGFYADPETYFAIGFLPDPPCGEFMEDFDHTEELGVKPGHRARAALARYHATKEAMPDLLAALEVADGVLAAMTTWIQLGLANATFPGTGTAILDDVRAASAKTGAALASAKPKEGRDDG